MSASACLLLIRTRCNRRDQGGNEIRTIAVGGLWHIMQTTVAVPEANIGYQGYSLICDARIGQHLGEKALQHMSLGVVSTLYSITRCSMAECTCVQRITFGGMTCLTLPCKRVVLRQL